MDYISGREVAAKPEEVDATQLFSKHLVEDYGYPKNHIQTRPQFRVRARPSASNKSYPVDIAVFDHTEKTEDALYIIVECKKKNRKDGIKQLQQYMSLSSAQLGVWFNGEERFFFRKIVNENGNTGYEEIPNIPRYGERIEDLGKFKRRDLISPHNLKSVFTTIRNRLAANNVGATRDEVLAKQIINLIFCKIYDEKYTPPDRQVKFRAGIEEHPNFVLNRVSALFDKVKAKYEEVFDEADKIDLDPNSVVSVIGELQQYCLLNAARDVVSDAFETFIGKALKGENGQFFTPRNVVELIVKIIAPKPGEKILDPACGSGGFLIETLRHVWNVQETEGKKLSWDQQTIDNEKLRVASTCFFGIDKDNFLAKVTKAYMTLVGDGTAGVVCENSLEKQNRWTTETRQKIQLGQFDVIITNPPFGSKKLKVEGEEILSQYKLARNWRVNKETGEYRASTKLKEKVPPQILFIERCLQFLRDKGRMAIILPETNVHAPTLTYIVEYIKQQCRVLGVLDLPHNTFRPYCNAKTIVLFLQKDSPQQDIQMYVAEQMGHDHLGKPMYRWDSESQRFTNEIWDDLEEISKEMLGSEKIGSSRKYIFNLSPEAVRNNVYVPRYYWESYDVQIRELADKKNMLLFRMEDLISQKIIQVFKGHGSPKGPEKGLGEVPYVRAADILNWRIYKNPIAGITEDVYKRVKGKNGVELREGDIIFVKEGSYRIGDCAIVSSDDADILLNSHCLVFRVLQGNHLGINGFYFLTSLTHQIVKIQLPSKVLIDTTLPNIGNRWNELQVPIHKDLSKRENFRDLSEKTIRNYWKANKAITEIRKSVAPLMLVPRDIKSEEDES